MIRGYFTMMTPTIGNDIYIQIDNEFELKYPYSTALIIVMSWKKEGGN